ncbi:hypothetical protein BKA70DRAFT_1228119 [Coprinopsis sp. MPI-PUGE-AT-0042]|nr:hypothetical protein BKA70DRAFT_1228119 [Coprinopsis sp. MPI-PUGE-AT-0042]
MNGSYIHGHAASNPQTIPEVEDGRVEGKKTAHNPLYSKTPTTPLAPGTVSISVEVINRLTWWWLEGLARCWTNSLLNAVVYPSRRYERQRFHAMRLEVRVDGKVGGLNETACSRGREGSREFITCAQSRSSPLRVTSDPIFLPRMRDRADLLRGATRIQLSVVVLAILRPQRSIWGVVDESRVVHGISGWTMSETSILTSPDWEKANGGRAASSQASRRQCKCLGIVPQFCGEGGNRRWNSRICVLSCDGGGRRVASKAWTTTE